MTKVQKKSFLTTFFSCMSVALMLLIVVSSCNSSRSVRQKRAKGLKNNAYANSPYVPTSKNDVMTRRLFMQNRRASIELPKTDGMHIDPTTGAVVVSENVTFTHADNYTGYFEHNDILTDTVYSLSEVTVTARSRFTPEHEGKINVDFMVQVPRELISPEWRLILKPSIVEEDTIIYLEPLVIKGSEFYNKQKNDYAVFDAYLNSIVDTASYDSAFLDQDGINFDINNRQSFYYAKYYREWDRQMAFEKWKVDQENANEAYMAVELGKRKELYHQYARKANDEAMKALSFGRDTVGMWGKHMNEFKVRTKDMENNWAVNTAVRKIPSEFVDLYESGRTFDDIYNDILTVQDSLKISKHRYFFDLIAENELKAARVDDRRKEMIQFPFEEGVRDTLIVSTPQEVKFYYKQTYPTRVGLKRIDIVLDGRIEAMDHSTYTVATSDTLSYFVASLAQLADMSLVQSESTVYRDVFNRMTAYIKFAPNKTDVDEFYSDNQDQIKKIMDVYDTFTKEGGLVVDSMELTVSTSLDGTYENNAERTMKRSHAIKDFFVGKYGDQMDESIFRTYYMGEDWNTLANEIKRDNSIKNQDAILDLLANAVNPDYTELMVKRKYPGDFKRISDNIYPKLNKVEIVFNMHRPGMTEASEQRIEEKPEYEKGVELLLNRDYWAAIEILADYPDYNTALCLACMGYNAKSLELLQSLTPNGYSEYLLAILKLRLGKEEEAVAHLVNACELDPSKVYRTELDPEILGLVRKYNLKFNAPALPEPDEDYGSASASQSATSSSDADEATTTEEEAVTTEEDATAEEAVVYDDAAAEEEAVVYEDAE